VVIGFGCGARFANDCARDDDGCYQIVKHKS